MEVTDSQRCWNCGRSGTPGVGSRLMCTMCDVTWMPWTTAPRPMNDRVMHMGESVPVVNFTAPGALSSPA